ncbi:MULTISPECIES: hypothetical protein [Streptomyces]|uniref:hypothetical protein n=1 Tax=Streptomyces TaxID=1883 RepID=UPI0022495D3D|nr:hypothetical protein [Streptomyces sp. JHD 1]MCX2968725.1 hypothetical protein [Streptomyces sp. JHD 1]
MIVDPLGLALIAGAWGMLGLLITVAVYGCLLTLLAGLGYAAARLLRRRWCGEDATGTADDDAPRGLAAFTWTGDPRE